MKTPAITLTLVAGTAAFLWFSSTPTSASSSSASAPLSAALLASSLPAAPAAVAAPVISQQDEMLNLRGSLALAGLTPERLAAAGVVPSEIAAIVERARGNSAVSNREVISSKTAFGQSKVDRERLERAVRKGDHRSETMQNMQSARAAEVSARNQHDAAMQSLFAQATSVLSQGSRSALRTIEANRAYANLPLQYLVVERTPAEWAELKEALTHERVCTRRGDDMWPDHIAVLVQARANPIVAASKASIDGSSAEMATAWDLATRAE